MCGAQGVNVEKMAEEGEPSTTQLLWGLHMNFDTQEVRLPEPKRIKAKYLLGETALQRGCREVPLRLLQELIGCAQYWTVACPALTPHLPTLYHLLKGNLQGNANNTLVQVEAGSHAEEDRRWEDFGTHWTLSGCSLRLPFNAVSFPCLRNCFLSESG